MAKENIADMKVGTSEFAAIIGKSPQWVRQLTREGVLNQVSRGKYKLAENIQAYYEHKTGEGGSETNLNYNREKTLLTKAKREIEENKLRVMKGELHQSEDVEAVMTDMLTRLRSRLLVIPEAVSPKLVGATDVKVIRSLIKQEVHSALNELSDYDPEDFKPDDVEFIDENEKEKN